MGVDYLDGIGQNHSNTMSYCTRITLVSAELCVVTADDWFGLLLGGHVGHQVADTVAVAELIVVPG